MPCTSEGYSDPTQHEKYVSRAAAVIEEAKGGPAVSRDAWRGYHPRVMGRLVSREEADAIVAEACALMTAHPDTSTLSLEAQMWWRDHQAKDAARAERKAREAERTKKRKAALAKLTAAERRLLGLE